MRWIGVPTAGGKNRLVLAEAERVDVVSGCREGNLRGADKLFRVGWPGGADYARLPLAVTTGFTPPQCRTGPGSITGAGFNSGTLSPL